MVFALEHMANGLLVGTYYIILALGLSLIFSLGGVVNLAHGAFMRSAPTSPTRSSAGSASLAPWSSRRYWSASSGW